MIIVVMMVVIIVVVMVVMTIVIVVIMTDLRLALPVLATDDGRAIGAELAIHLRRSAFGFGLFF